MTSSRTNPKVDRYLSGVEKWRAEFDQLRALVLACELTEDVKWGQPCYMRGGRNIVLIHGFKEYCALLFFKGALMDDAHGLLIRQTENVQAGRQIRFTSVQQIMALEPVLRTHIHNAVAVEQAGLKIARKKTAEFEMPEEFHNKLETMPALKAAFEALTPGRQRAYLLHFAAPKQAKTRESRIESCVQRILDGKGLSD